MHNNILHVMLLNITKMQYGSVADVQNIYFVLHFWDSEKKSKREETATQENAFS